MSEKPVNNAGRGGQELTAQPFTAPAARINKRKRSVAPLDNPLRGAAQLLLSLQFAAETPERKEILSSRKRCRAEQIAPNCPL